MMLIFEPSLVSCNNDLPQVLQCIAGFSVIGIISIVPMVVFLMNLAAEAAPAEWDLREAP